MTNILGIVIPSTSPAFLAVVAVHVVAGLTCVIAGMIAMLSSKGPMRHARFGTMYYRGLTVVFVTAAALSIVRWQEDYYLFLLGTLAFVAATLGRRAMQERWRNWARLHVLGMGSSYVVLLTAFYVDNGKSLPVWKELPVIAYWTLPALIGFPIILWAMMRHPIVLGGIGAGGRTRTDTL